MKVFTDDLNIHSITWEDHFNHICMVLQRLKDVILKFNMNKCVFSTKNIKFLGHMFENARTRLDPNKVKIVVEFLIPIIVTNIRAFLALTSTIVITSKIMQRLLPP